MQACRCCELADSVFTSHVNVSSSVLDEQERVPWHSSAQRVAVAISHREQFRGSKIVCCMPYCRVRSNYKCYDYHLPPKPVGVLVRRLATGFPSRSST